MTLPPVAHRLAALLVVLLAHAASATGQAPASAPAARPATPAAPLDPCAVIPPATLRRLDLPATVRGVRDSSGVTCQWGSIEDRRALVVKTYAVMAPETLERMRIAAAATSDPILEPHVAPGAWSVGKSFGRVLMVARNGRGLQLQYYVRPHSKGADRVDVRATNADRLALVAVARAAAARL